MNLMTVTIVAILGAIYSMGHSVFTDTKYAIYVRDKYKVIPNVAFEASVVLFLTLLSIFGGKVTSPSTPELPSGNVQTAALVALLCVLVRLFFSSYRTLY